MFSEVKVNKSFQYGCTITTFFYIHMKQKMFYWLNNTKVIHTTNNISFKIYIQTIYN